MLALANEIQVGGLLNTPILTANTTYYVTQTLNDCTSDTAQVSVTISSLVATPTLTANPIQVCSGSPTTLTSSAGVKTVWYNDAGITRVGSGATYTTPALLSTSTFYAKDTTGCSSKLASIVIVVNPLPESPQAITPSPICAGSTVTIQGGGVNTVWYSTPNAAVGTNIGAGPSYTTPILNGNTTYYLRNEIGNCKSAITSVTVTVNPIPAAPTVSGNNPVCEGESITLTANCTGSNARWYNSANQLVFTGSQYTISNPVNGATYTVECTNGNCTSSRTNVTLTVNPAAQLPIGVADYSICQGQTIPNGEGLQASCTSGNSGSSGSLVINGAGANFFIGNNELDGTVSFNATSIPANALVTDISLTMSLSHVYAGDVEIDLANPGGSIIAVHDGNGGNDNFINANTYTFSNTGISTIGLTTGDLNIPTGNYIPIQSFTAFNNTNASGIWTLQVGDNFPASDDGQFNSATLTINYIVPASAGDITWWDAPIGGNELSDEGTFVPSNYSSLTPGEYSYYAQCGNATTCANGRTEVKFTVLPALTPPTISGSDPICSGTSAVLEADNVIGTVEWYADADLTTLLATGLTFNTPNLIANTTYYAINNNGQCNSVPAVYTVEVTPLPTFLFGTFPQASSSGNIEICEGEKVNAFALLDDPDNQVALLYTEARPLNPLQDWLIVGIDDGSGIAEFEINTTSDAIYYVRVLDLNTGCISNPRRIYIDVFNRRDAPEVEGTTVCVDEDAIVRAFYTNFVNDFNPENDAVEIVLRDAEGVFLDAIEIDPANNITTAEFNVGSFIDAGVYSFLVSSVVYHEDNDIFYCESYPAIVNVNVVDAAEQPEITNDTICIGEVAVLTADSKDEIIWYSDVNLTTIVGTGNVLALTGLTETTNYYAVASNGTCKSEPIMATVVVNPLPAKPIVNANSPVCEGATISLSTTTTGNVTYNWTGPNGYTSNVQNPEITPAVKATHQGIYTLTIKDNTTGCTSMAASVQVDINPAPAAPTATNSGPVCEGANAIVSASLVTGAIYSWTGPNGFSSSLQVNNIMNVSLANAGTYSVSIYKDGCWSTAATTTLVVNAKPIIDSVVSNDPVCENQQIIITAYTTAQNINNYNWTVPDGNTINSTSNVLTIDTAEVSDRGMYILTITDANNCKSNPIAEYVDVNKYPDNIIATNNGPKCEGEDIQLNAPNIFGATYSWTGPNQFVSDLRNPTLQDVTVANAGTYTLVVSLGNCSSAPVTTDVVVHANPTANAGLDDTTYQDQPLVLNGSGGSTYQWSNSDYLSTTVTPNPIFIANVVGNYTKTLTVWDDATGCSDDDDVVITVLPKVELSIPDLITPNGDGINDKWVIKYLDNIKESYVINVYARGGALVMTTSSYNQDWTGTYKDKQLPDGAYWYAIELSNGVVYKGTLTIKR
jgi:gliding motility-associated-like protein